MSRDDSPAIFPAGSNATPVNEIKPPSPDPRAARVHRVHQQIVERVKDRSIYRPTRDSR